VLEAAVKAFKKLVNENNEVQVPVVFVTNALNRNIDKATQLAGWLGVKVVRLCIAECMFTVLAWTAAGLVQIPVRSSA